MLPQSALQNEVKQEKKPGALQRLFFRSLGFLGWVLIHTLGLTWRWEIHGWENFEALQKQQLPFIMAFWHGRILPAMYYFRNRGIVVLTSENKDGEYIAHVIHAFGYGSSRGSTSRGAVKGTIKLIRTLKQGAHVGFTVDGPRGPRHKVQQGVTWLASYSQRPILPFHVEGRSAKNLGSWDGFQIPLPFSMVRLDIAPAMWLRPNMSEAELEASRIELENTLNSLSTSAEDWARGNEKA